MDLKVQLPAFERPSRDAGKLVGDAGKLVGEAQRAVGDAGRVMGAGLETAGKGLEAVGGRLQMADRIDAFRNPHRAQGPGPAVSGLALIGGVSAGMALMYFLDPEEGARRRRILMDRLGSLGGMVSSRGKSASDDFGDGLGDLQSTATGFAGDAGSGLGGNGTAGLGDIGGGVGSGTYDASGYTASTGAIGGLGTTELGSGAGYGETGHTTQTTYTADSGYAAGTGSASGTGSESGSGASTGGSSTDAWAEAETYAVDRQEESR